MSLSMCFTIRHGKHLGETLKFPRLSRVSEAATFRLGLVSDKILNVTVSSRSRRHGSRVSSWSRLRRSRAHPCRSDWYGCSLRDHGVILITKSIHGAYTNGQLDMSGQTDSHMMSNKPRRLSDRDITCYNIFRTLYGVYTIEQTSSWLSVTTLTAVIYELNDTEC